MASDQPESTSPDQQRWEVFQRSFGQLLRMSEMTWALAGVASLDEALKDLLAAFFVDNAKAAEDLLSDRGLSVYRATELAFLLGLISARERELLHLLRKIRNALAHEVNLTSLPEVSFTQSPIKELCAELDEVKLIRLEREPVLSEPATRFMNSCAFLWVVLAGRKGQIEHREEAQSVTEEDLYSRLSEFSESYDQKLWMRGEAAYPG